MIKNVNSYLSKNNLPALLLSFGLAFVFLYAGIAALVHPLEWIGYLPSFLGTFIVLTVAIKIIATYEILLGVWLLSGLYRKIAAALTALTLLGILLANFTDFIVTFRDIGLFFAAVALFFMPTEVKPSNSRDQERHQEYT